MLGNGRWDGDEVEKEVKGRHSLGSKELVLRGHAISPVHIVLKKNKKKTLQKKKQNNNKLQYWAIIIIFGFLQALMQHRESVDQ